MHSNQPGIPQRGVCIRISIYCCQGGGSPCKKGASTHSIALTFMVDQRFSCLQQFAAVYSEQSSIVIEELQNPGQNIQAIKCVFLQGGFY